jgi:hypothetical protein
MQCIQTINNYATRCQIWHARTLHRYFFFHLFKNRPGGEDWA